MFEGKGARFVIAAVFYTVVVVGLLPGRGQAQTFTVEAVIPSTPGQMAYPNSEQLVQGRNGEIYASAGGLLAATTSGSLSLASTAMLPQYYPVLGSDNNFYTGLYIDSIGCGEVWKIAQAGTGAQIASICGTYGNGPWGPPIQHPNGMFYGTASEMPSGGNGTIYSMTSAGALKLLHAFAGTDGAVPVAPLVVGSDGNLYGGTTTGGKNNDGVLFRITPSGNLTVLHNFTGTDGRDLERGMIVGRDGNLYGVTQYGGTDNIGVAFKLTNSGTYTVLYSFLTPYSTPYTQLVQGTNGVFYGVLGQGNASQPGWIYSLTTTGTFKILHEFCQKSGCTDGIAPTTPLIQHTDGKFYGFTVHGGDESVCGGNGCGVFYSFDVGLAPFINLSTYSGSVGSTVGIFGQGFDSASVVKFNGVAATKLVLSGTTYITATVPAGATDGKVTVTTGTTTLSSTKNFIVHNTWSKGKAMPVAVQRAAAAQLEGLIYVVGGENASGSAVADVQIYNPATNTWSTGTSLPAATQDSSAAVVNNILYIVGGDNGIAPPTNAVWAYDPSTKKWTGKSAMLTARNGTLAVVENGVVYVMGGNLGGGPNFVATVESYNTTTNTWKTEASMDGAKDFPAGGLIGTTIVVADGAPTGSAVTGDTEGYNAGTNKWAELTADPTARTGPCSGVVNGALYDTTGYINNAGAATKVNESFNLSTNKWTTTLVAIPQGTMFPASVVSNGQLYCFGGSAVVNSSAISNVQIYQP